MQILRNAALVAGAATLLLTGCDDGVAPVPEPPSATVNYGVVIPFGTPDQAQAVSFDGDEKAALRQQYGLLRSQLIDVLEKSDTASKRDVAAREFLAANTTSPLAPFLEQFAAHRMLESLLADADAEGEQVDYYTRLLVKNHSPDADVIYRAVLRLGDMWSRSEVQEVSLVTAKRAERWTKKVCPECASGSSYKTSSNAGLALKRTAVVAAARGLRELAGP